MRLLLPAKYPFPVLFPAPLFSPAPSSPVRLSYLRLPAPTQKLRFPSFLLPHIPGRCTLKYATVHIQNPSFPAFLHSWQDILHNAYSSPNRPLLPAMQSSYLPEAYQNASSAPSLTHLQTI